MVGRWRLRWTTAIALAVLAGGAAAARADEPLPGLLDPAVVEKAHEGARAQRRDARAAVRRNARLLGYEDREIDRALEPTMVRQGSFIHTLDDGTEIEFPWFRTGFAENDLANTKRRVGRGPDGRALKRETNKGGLRLHFGVFAEEVYALALKMDGKLGIAGDALDGQSVRGAKGGIGAGRVVKVGTRYAAKVGDYVDPAGAAIDRKQVMRQFGRSYRAAGGEVGPGLDIQAGDVNTKAPEMQALSEEYGVDGRPSPGVSGKGVRTRADGSADPDGGIEYRAVSTGEGVWMSARLASRRAGLKIRGATVVAQGWGEVGRSFGVAAARDGARVIAVQNLWKTGGEKKPGMLMNPHGAAARPRQVKAFIADVDRLLASGEDIETFEGGRMASWLEEGVDASDVQADIVGVNALGEVLTTETVPRYARSGTHAGARKIIVEGANLAETAGGARAIDRLAGKLMVVPGELANLGGVHVSNLEAVQNIHQREVTSARARRSLQGTMRSGWTRAMRIADEKGLSERAAIELAAVDAMMKRSLDMPGAPRIALERGALGSVEARKLLARARAARPAPRATTPRKGPPARAGAIRHMREASRSAHTATHPRTFRTGRVDKALQARERVRTGARTARPSTARR